MSVTFCFTLMIIILTQIGRLRFADDRNVEGMMSYVLPVMNLFD